MIPSSPPVRKSSLFAQPEGKLKLRIIRRGTILIRMRQSLHPRSRLFRSLLALALLAWTGLAFGAFARPVTMDMVAMNMAMSKIAPASSMASHCDGMAMSNGSHASHPAPSHSPGQGHGCCSNGGCYCASLCTGIASVPSLVMTWPPARDPALRPVHPQLALAISAPPLRPPIA